MTIAIILALVIALVVCLIFYAQMKTTAIKEDAQEYISGSLHITDQNDIYIRTTSSRVKIESNKK